MVESRNLLSSAISDVELFSYVGKFSFANRTTADWNQLPEEVFWFPQLKPIPSQKELGRW
jgi:hypothetical protein